MRVPDESLDDFKVPPNTKLAEPPQERSLQLTGEVEVLRPLARRSDLSKFRAAANKKFLGPEPLPGTSGLSWYHRSLAFSGAVAVGALLLGIFAGLYAPSEPSGSQGALVTDRRYDAILPLPKEAEVADGSAFTKPDSVPDKSHSARSVNKRKFARSSGRRKAHQPEAVVYPPQLVMSEFVPTTLVIYIENGEVRTRIELHPTAAHKKRT